VFDLPMTSIEVTLSMFKLKTFQVFLAAG
jgi:hypothetical protein